MHTLTLITADDTLQATLLLLDDYAVNRTDVQGAVASAAHLVLLDARGNRDPLPVLGSLVEIGCVVYVLLDELEPKQVDACLGSGAADVLSNQDLYPAVLRLRLRAGTAQSLDNFMRYATHQMKSALSAVSGFSELLLTGVVGDLNERQQEFVNTVRQNAERLDAFITDVRDVISISVARLAIDLAPLSVLDLMRPALRQVNAVFETSRLTHREVFPEDLPLVNGSAARLVRVFAACLRALAEDAYEGSEIITQARALEFGVEVLLSNNGHGLSPAENEQIHAPYRYRAGAIWHDETGYGMSIHVARHTITAHGGQFSIQRVPQQGTTFRFTLPLAPG